MTTSLENTIIKLLNQLKSKKGYVLADSNENLARKLSQGFAVDSIFFQRNDDTLDELRVWYEDFMLVSRDGPIASFY